jgi:NAD(P)-dependent dehydrogenase (short-subunit alcohol dehydrogenase family)
VDLGVRDQPFILFGGTRGMGLAAASTVAADGATLALVGRDADRAAEVAAELASRHSTIVLGIGANLDDEGSADRVVAEAVEQLGPLQGAAITTGLGASGQRGLLDASDGDWSATFEDVLMGTVRACRAVVPALVESGGGCHRCHRQRRRWHHLLTRDQKVGVPAISQVLGPTSPKLRRRPSCCPSRRRCERSSTSKTGRWST